MPRLQRDQSKPVLPTLPARLEPVIALMSTPLPDALSATQTPGQRGPLQHEMRDRIVERADARFRHYGFAKTTIAEIAADLDVSTAYVYKFFDSKLAICEAMRPKRVGVPRMMAS